MCENCSPQSDRPQEFIEAQPGPDGILPLSTVEWVIRERNKRDYGLKFNFSGEYEVADAGPYTPPPEEATNPEATV